MGFLFERENSLNRKEPFQSAVEMEKAALDAAAAGALVLVPTSRLAKRYRHAWRLRQMEAGDPTAWKTPDILNFHGWLRRLHQGLWEERQPIPKAVQLRLWKQACEETPDNPGLALDLALYEELQRTYDRLSRSALQGAGGGGHRTQAWRQEVTRRFDRLSRAGGYEGWHDVVRAVRKAFDEDRLEIPRDIVLVLRDEPEPLDLALFETLEGGGCTLEACSLAGDGDTPVCKVYATPEQECRAVCHAAMEAWNGSSGKSYLGIVAMDEDYFPLLATSLEELSGREPAKEGTGRFNLTRGVALPDHPLFQTAVLPLRLGSFDNPAAALSSLLSSPYVNPDDRGLAPRDIGNKLWPDDKALTLQDALDVLPARHGLKVALKELSRLETAPLSRWIARLRAVWDALGFPWKGGSEGVRAAGASAEESLRKALAELERFAGDVKVSAEEALEWLRTVCSGQQVVEAGAESGGIQVLNSQEAFGIPFDGLWAVGCHGGVLPAPVPASPLLAPEEARLLDGVAHEKAWQDAEQRLAALRALCLDAQPVSFTRAFQEPGGDPFLPSPFLHDEWRKTNMREGETEKHKDAPFTFDVWDTEMPRWLAAPWLEGTVRGLRSPVSPAPPEPALLQGSLPEEMGVSSLKGLMNCPYQFFASDVLGLSPLPTPPEGISPLVRGNLVHEILKEFMQAVRDTKPAWWPEDEQDAWGVLWAVARKRLGEERGPEWAAERLRLLGDNAEGEGGVLRAWLDAERAHALQGWRPLFLEETFGGFQPEGLQVRLRGRIDRVDGDGAGGRWIMDYKTGKVPAKKAVAKDWTEPQLPAYAAAVAAGLLEPQGSTPPEGPLKAGYVPLGNPSEVAVAPFTDRSKEPDWHALSEGWARVVASRLDAPEKGRFQADPWPDGVQSRRAKEPCRNCGFHALCGFYDDPGRAFTGEEDPEEDGP